MKNTRSYLLRHAAQKTAFLGIVLIFQIFFSNQLHAQDDGYYIDDEECGCELFFIEGIQTTRGDNGLFGFRLADGTLLTPNIYKYVDRFHNGYCRVFLDDGQCGLIDRFGSVVVPCIYDGMEYPSEGRIAVFSHSHVGYCNLDGVEVIPPIYLQGAGFSDGCAAVQLADGCCAFIDTLGQMLFDRTFDNVRPFHNGHALVCDEGRWGLIARDGSVAMPIVHTAITENTGRLFLAGSLNHMAVYKVADLTQPHSRSTAQPLTCITDSIYAGTLGYSEGLLSVVRNGRFGFVDTTGREVVPCIYDETGLFQQGRTLVRIGDRYGIVDTAGRIILPLEYDPAPSRGNPYTYNDSRALIAKNGKLTYVDLDGRPILPFALDDAYQFSDGLAAVKMNGAWGYIDTTGNIFMPFVFDRAAPYQYGRAEVVYNGHVSKVDLKGRCVKNCNGIIAWREINE